MFRWFPLPWLRSSQKNLAQISQMARKSNQGPRFCKPRFDCLEERLNPSPIAVDDAFAAPHGQWTSLEALANDVIPAGHTVGAQITQWPSHAMVWYNSITGQFQFMANNNFVGLETFKYKLLDGPEYSNEATVAINVTGPFAVDDSATVHHGQSVLIDALANDANPNSEALNVNITQQPSHGTVYYDLTLGQFHYSANNSYVGQDTFKYALFNGALNQATVTIGVTNSKSLVTDDSGAKVLHGQTVLIDALANDSNPDGDTLTVIITQWAGHGMVFYNYAAGRFQYYAMDSVVGPDSFKYKLFDGAEYSDVATVSLLVTTTPTLTLTLASVVGNQATVVGQVHDEAPNGLQVVISGVACGTTTTGADGSFTFTGTLSGPGIISAQTTDGDNNVSPPVQVEVVNAAPFISMSITNVYRNQVTVTGQVLDEDAGPFTVTFTGKVTGSVITQLDGSFSYTGTATGVGTISATTKDALCQVSNAAQVTLTSNVPVILNFQAIDQQINNFWTFRGQVMDEAAPGLTVTLGGLASLSGQTVTVDFDGWFSLTVQLQAGETGFASAIVTDWLNQTSSAVFAFV